MAGYIRALLLIAFTLHPFYSLASGLLLSFTIFISALFAELVIIMTSINWWPCLFAHCLDLLRFTWLIFQFVSLCCCLENTYFHINQLQFPRTRIDNRWSSFTLVDWHLLAWIVWPVLVLLWFYPSRRAWYPYALYTIKYCHTNLSIWADRWACYFERSFD